MMKLPNITADIEKETMSISKYVSEVFEHVYQEEPSLYVPNTCLVYWEQDDVASETSAVDRYDRVYNIISFAKLRVDGIRQINRLQQLFTNLHSLQIEGSSRYMRIGSFLPSRPFLTGNREVYASISKLHVQVRQMAVQEVHPPIGGVIIRPGRPVEGEDGGIIIKPGDGDDIVIGTDCRKGEM